MVTIAAYTKVSSQTRVNWGQFHLGRGDSQGWLRLSSIFTATYAFLELTAAYCTFSLELKPHTEPSTRNGCIFH